MKSRIVFYNYISDPFIRITKTPLCTKVRSTDDVLTLILRSHWCRHTRSMFLLFFTRFETIDGRNSVRRRSRNIGTTFRPSTWWKSWRCTVKFQHEVNFDRRLPAETATARCAMVDTVYAPRDAAWYMLKSLRWWRCISSSMALQTFQTEYLSAPLSMYLAQPLKMSNEVRCRCHLDSDHLTPCQGVL